MNINELIKKAHDNDNYRFKSGIYCIININTNKLYIGSAKNLKKRKSGHFNSLKNNTHHCKYLQRAYNKYGIDNFIFKTIIYCEINELLFYEQKIINIFDFKKDLYNVLPTAGNNTGFKHSKETKNKMRKSSLGKIMSEESKLKMSISKQNMTKETKLKISKSNKGKKLTDEHRKKISQKTKGKNNAWWGKKFSNEYRKKLSDAKIKSDNNSIRKPIIAIDYTTKKEIGYFRSITDCSKFLKIESSGISRVLSGKYKNTKGYSFKFTKKIEGINGYKLFN